MRFGLFHLLQKSEPAKRDGEIFAEMLEQTLLAETLGFEAVWFGEHHFSSYSVCPSPLLAVTYCAARTERIKLGTGVVVLPLYDPVRLVQEIALVDAVCGGRLLLGIGSGYQPYEFARFGLDIANKNAMFSECLDILELGLTQPQFSYDGQYYKVPRMQLAIQAVQRPIPEIWVAGQMPPDIKRRVVASGYIPFVTPTVRPVTILTQVRDDYRAVAREVGRDPNYPLALMRYLHVTDSRAEAEDMARRALYSSRISTAMRNDNYALDGFMVQAPPIPDEPSIEALLNNIVCGDPETCAERLANDIAVMNPAHIAFYVQPGGMPQRRALRTIERLATEVLPAIEKAIGPLDRIGGRRPAPVPQMGKAA
ncbi:MAG: LLM class flavin-dependent oxidoreductase [Alphaproteobacteria bacterium]|nr:LLM class flavin-dependent oxidoreductase [Alphaproteobacteria bacterium]